MCDFIEKRTNYPLQYFAQLRGEDRFCLASGEEISRILRGDKINVVDVGARGGLEKSFEKYRALCNITFCEADSQEAERLRNEGGAKVFDCIVGSDADTKKLIIGKHPGTSSSLNISPRFLDFYCSSSTGRFEPSGEIYRPSVSLETLLIDHVENIDYLKIDTQGSELDVLKGLGALRPIIIKCEISYIPLYEGSTLIWEVQQHLYDLGYICFHISSVMRSAPQRHNSDRPFDKTVVPLHGDAYFMPDWSRWHSVVGDRVRKYQALMQIFGLEDVFEYSTCNKN